MIWHYPVHIRIEIQQNVLVSSCTEFLIQSYSFFYIVVIFVEHSLSAAIRHRSVICVNPRKALGLS